MSFEAFSRLAEEYDSWYKENEGLYREELECVRRAVKGRCLEVGAGTGAFSAPLGCVALDPALGALRLAKGKGAEAVLGVAEALPFRSSSFDTVAFVTSLCFVQDKERSLKEAKRVGKRVVVCALLKESELVKSYEEKGRRGHPIFKYARFLSREELGSVGEEVCSVGDFFACYSLSL
ncbi:class I SAM-dependent methyltransferase [Ignicoccus hospitalis]|nr:methyltransferase domain-containing protein [Ignicoccus hospitalis]HIH90788.1 methyltransferase domain-containing protein [Desulfurococcaceae archaeon]